jgi:O-antigen/teichoic acid export membrane protein
MGKSKEGYIPLRNFALMLGFIVISILGIIAFSPLANVWFHNISGLSIQLTDFAKLPLIIMVIMPGLSVLLSFQTAVLVESHNTKPITFSTITEFSGILITMFIAIKYFNAVGVVAATLGFIIGRIGANLYLFPPYFKSLKSKSAIIN